MNNPANYSWSSYPEIFKSSDLDIIDQTESRMVIGESEIDKENSRKFIYKGIRSIDELSREYNDFEKDIKGKVRFNTLAQKKYLRRKKGILKTI